MKNRFSSSSKTRGDRPFARSAPRAKSALGSGFLGACAATAASQFGKRFLPRAPRLDLLGMQLASKVMKKGHSAPPRGPALYLISLVGDLFSNSLFYSLVGAGRSGTAWLRGSLLGLAAGVGAVTLPQPMGLNRKVTTRSRQTVLLTITWYVLGGLVAALAYRKLRTAGNRQNL